MKVVAGKPNSPTPQFSTWCNQVIFYPYWYVPGDIAVKELLPKFKKDPSQMDAMNMELIDSAGNVIDRSTINWDSLNRDNFHYRFRQATGCSNSLGVIKFNLTDPFDVYMHDTNFKEAFESKAHYISHGCIRLEQPVELAKYLIGDRMDEEFVRSCLQGQGPVVNKVTPPIPVFVVYLTAYTSDNKVIYSKDVYGLLK
jgi:murein L,D-transpeptidase YcbB/YkuD